MSSVYFDYLMKISWKGRLYRKKIVYPLIKKNSKGRLLDIGCGTGLFLEFFQTGTGVDVNSDCVEYCRQNGLDAIQMEFDILPFEDESFDTVVLDNVLEHINDPQPILEECYRVLTDQGRIIALTPGKKGYSRDPDHKIYYSMDTLRDLIQQHGFEPKLAKEIPFRGLENLLSAFCFFAVGRKNVQ